DGQRRQPRSGVDEVSEMPRAGHGGDAPAARRGVRRPPRHQGAGGEHPGADRPVRGGGGGGGGPAAVLRGRGGGGGGAGEGRLRAGGAAGGGAAAGAPGGGAAAADPVTGQQRPGAGRPRLRSRLGAAGEMTGPPRPVIWRAGGVSPLLT